MLKPSKGTAARKPANGSKETLATRDQYALVREPGRTMLQIEWYDRERRKVARESAKSADEVEARAYFDSWFAKRTGGPCICKECGQIIREGNGTKDVLVVMADYLASKPRGSEKAEKAWRRADDRLKPIRRYIETEVCRTVPVSTINDIWVQGFRDWFATADGCTRAASWVEQCVNQLAAALRHSRETPMWKARNHVKMSRAMRFRVDVPQLAAMFDYCVRPARGDKTDGQYAMAIAMRRNLLCYLRFAVATLARPEAVLEASTHPERDQWHSADRVFDLHPAGADLTDKRRALVPVAEPVARWLDGQEPGPVVPGGLNPGTFSRMVRALNLDAPKGQQGYKLIRRAMATLVRKRIGEANKAQLKIMMGHGVGDITDLYALFDPSNLGLAAEAIAAIINEIEELCPGAFVDRATDNVVRLHRKPRGPRREPVEVTRKLGRIAF